MSHANEDGKTYIFTEMAIKQKVFHAEIRNSDISHITQIKALKKYQYKIIYTNSDRKIWCIQYSLKIVEYLSPIKISIMNKGKFS